jgi:hypothetical protein
MTTRSAKEIGESYISAMGEDLGGTFFVLYRQLVELHIVWQQYQQLFGAEQETVSLLNRSAGLFFKIIQDELWDSVLLGISRMTDPPAIGQNKNLTIQCLPKLLPNTAIREEVQTLCEKAVHAAKFAREHRNKRIAHQDHEYLSNCNSNPLSGISRVRVDTMLAALRDVLNCLDCHFRDTTVVYENFIDESGARVLVNKLRKLESLQAQQAK